MARYRKEGKSVRGGMEKCHAVHDFARVLGTVFGSEIRRGRIKSGPLLILNRFYRLVAPIVFFFDFCN